MAEFGSLVFEPQFEDRRPQARPVQRGVLDDLFKGLLESAARGFTAPGRALQGGYAVQPETPGQWSEADEFKRRTADQRMLGDAMDFGGLVMGGGIPNAQAGAVGAAGGKLITPQPTGIRAYHGSPHDFDRFDISKIGTGEGAQAYGHGLYFAENEGVASQYRNVLSQNPRVKGNPIVGTEGAAERYLVDAGGDVSKALELARAEAAALAVSEKKIDAFRARAANDAVSKLEGWRDANAVSMPGGKLYEVNINTKPEHFLDWDAPIKQQSSRIDQALFDILEPQGKSVANHILNSGTGEDVVRRMARPSYPILDETGAWKASGAKSFDEALDMVGGDKMRARRVFTPDPVYTAEALRERGVPGIRYLDQGSRGPSVRMQTLEDRIAREKAQGLPYDHWQKELDQLKADQMTRNYVVFDDSLVDILRKYGIAGVPAAGVAAGAAGGGFGSLDGSM